MQLGALQLLAAVERCPRLAAQERCALAQDGLMCPFAFTVEEQRPLQHIAELTAVRQGKDAPLTLPSVPEPRHKLKPQTGKRVALDGRVAGKARWQEVGGIDTLAQHRHHLRRHDERHLPGRLPEKRRKTVDLRVGERLHQQSFITQIGYQAGTGERRWHPRLQLLHNALFNLSAHLAVQYLDLACPAFDLLFDTAIGPQQRRRNSLLGTQQHYVNPGAEEAVLFGNLTIEQVAWRDPALQRLARQGLEWRHHIGGELVERVTL